MMHCDACMHSTKNNGLCDPIKNRGLCLLESHTEDKYTISIQPSERDNKNVEFVDALFCLISIYEERGLLNKDIDAGLQFAITNNNNTNVFRRDEKLC